MSEDSRKTINLRQKRVDAKRKTGNIDKVYESGEDLKNISRPNQIKSGWPKNFVTGLLLLIVCFFVYQYFFAGNGNSGQSNKEAVWYAIKLTDNTMYYGQIKEVDTDPVVIYNVYYDYDQLKNTDEADDTEAVKTIRLVKRGQEAHGPDGNLNVVRSQIIFMEPLRQDSKVLEAILQYEK